MPIFRGRPASGSEASRRAADGRRDVQRRVPPVVEARVAPDDGDLLDDVLRAIDHKLVGWGWEPGLNPNVTKTRTDQAEYFINLMRSGHGSVLEHANYSFVLYDISRVATHEIVRHRAGSAFSQESLRYVRLTDIGFRVPPALEPLRQRLRAARSTPWP